MRILFGCLLYERKNFMKDCRTNDDSALHEDGGACPSGSRQKWYAVQVRTGSECITARLCKSVMNQSVLTDCFIPRYERMRRYQAQWHQEYPIMFPGYIFLITDKVNALYEELKHVPRLTKILENGVEFIPLKEEEAELLAAMGSREHITAMSRGYIAGDRIIITEGPMKEMAGQIRFIDRHKRIAVVQMEMFGRKLDIRLGLEIVKKIV